MSRSHRAAAGLVVVGAVLGLAGILGHAPAVGHWRGTITVINGTDLDRVAKCHWPPGPDCALEVDAALPDVHAGRGAVVGASLGSLPTAWERPDGTVVLQDSGGLDWLAVVVVDLADGSRQLIPVRCGPDGMASDGSPVVRCTAEPDLQLPGPSGAPPFE